MNAAQLLTHFDRLAEAPDAVPRLRRFILDLAVRGKLVEQDAGDEPASELVKQIRLEKARLIKSGIAKNVDDLPPVRVDEQPFQLPASWTWVRLVNVLTKLTDGTHFSPANAPSGDFKYITAKNIKPEGVSLANVTYVSAEAHAEIYGRCDPSQGDILYIKDGATTGVVTINNLDEPFSMLSSVALLKVPNGLFNRLFVEFLRSPFFFDQMRGFMKGAAIPRVTLKRMGPALLPLPPLAEQHRIVAKVDELMALCDQLEAAQQERERRRDCLAAASLQRLNQPTEANPANDQTEPAEARQQAQREQQKDHARFHLQNLNRLTTRPEHIKAMRQTIFNLAVHGELVKQEAGEEPASLLLRRIAASRSQILAGADVRKKKPVSLDDLVPKTLPDGWSVEALANLVDPLNTISYGVLVPGPEVEDGVPFVRVQDLTLSGHPSRPNKSIAREIEKQYARTRLKGGEILLCVVGSIGKVGVAPTSWAGANIARAVCRISPMAGLDSQYLLTLFQSASVQGFFSSSTRTLAQPTLNVGLIEQLPVLVPPLAEQHRIVAKVDELMALCDQLEAQLTQSQTDSRRLLEALLEGALA